MKVLHKTLKKKWFEMISSGEKKEEYLAIKDYWVVRLFEVVKPLTLSQFGVNYSDIKGMFNFMWGYKGKSTGIKFLIDEGFIKPKQFDIVSANNGYQKYCPNVKWKHEGIEVRQGSSKWGAELGKTYFVLKIGELIK